MADAGAWVGGLSAALPRLELSTRAPDALSYARDLWPRHHIGVRAGRLPEPRPAAIAWPRSSEEVAELVAYCSRERIAVVPFGAGSGVCAGIRPTAGTLVIDLKRLNRWRRFAPEEGILEVEAGAMGIRLEEDLEARGYTVGHFPSSILCSTVGGWVAARGAGQCSGLYGKIEDMVAALEIVDGRGELATLRRRAHGPDLTPLVIGSEGILALVTSVTLRLHPAPVERGFQALGLPSMESGWETIRAIYQAGLRPAVCRLYDPFDSFMARRGAQKKSAPAHKKRRLAPGLGGQALGRLLRVPGAINAAIDALGTRVFGPAMLVLVFEGAPERIRGELAEACSIGQRLGASDLGEGPARHWLSHRYSVSYRQAPIFRMGAFADTMEVAAPWSRLGALYDGVRHALGERVMVMAHLSHAYPDGCSIYFTFAGSAASDDEAERIYDESWRAALGAALSAGGTLSHHHGVGRSKAPRLGDELGLGVDLVQALKRVLDPGAIFNPGNLLPERPPTRIHVGPLDETITVDERSQLVHAPASATLERVEEILRRAGLSLALDRDAPHGATTLGAWIAEGARGAPDRWLDPVDQLAAGYRAVLPSGGRLEVRPCPRRAVGPDLFSLFFGMNERAGRLERVSLRAHGRRPEALATPVARHPALDAGEERIIERCVEAAHAV
jgi:alkyldihydroxyacetonephosphate synthase